MPDDSLDWLGAIFFIVAIILFAVAVYEQSLGAGSIGLASGSFGVVCLIIAIMAFIHRSEK